MIKDEILQQIAPKTRAYASFIRTNLKWIKDFTLQPVKDKIFITFKIKADLSEGDVFLYEPMRLQMIFVTDTKPFWENTDMKVSELFYIPFFEKFGCYVMDESIPEELLSEIFRKDI